MGMARNSSNEVVEIDSSDDDFEEPRKRIGWNYQGKAIKEESNTDIMPTKINGRTKKEKMPDSDSDDLEVLEVTPVSKSISKSSKSKINGNKEPGLIPVSSTRSEIKVYNRLPQSTISQFFSPPKNKETSDKSISKSKVNNKVKNNISNKCNSSVEGNKSKEKNKNDKQEKMPLKIKWKKVTDKGDKAKSSARSGNSDEEKGKSKEKNKNKQEKTSIKCNVTNTSDTAIPSDRSGNSDEGNDKSKEKNKNDKQETPSIKWKKVTNTRDTAIPSDRSGYSESEESD